MPLIQFWQSEPKSVLKMTIKQIVNTAGDGNLRDDSECSRELREFLSQAEIEFLAEYAEQCLAEAFPKSGMVLQDIVNELGRRLDYVVNNGRYQGTTNTIGNDGLWHAPEGNDVVLEVKTTDAYRVPLDTIASYRNKLKEVNKLAEENSVLIVVGREDTGELEAQVRGSRHAWDMRLISVEALIRLVDLKQATEGPETGKKIRSLLIPREYTRLDPLIDVIFATANDVEVGVQIAAAQEDSESETENLAEASGWQFTDAKVMNAKREGIVKSFGSLRSAALIKKSRALYWSSDHALRVVCTISKRYQNQGATRYWYAYHPAWDDFLREATNGFFVLGCVDLDLAFALPVGLLRDRRQELNTTTIKSGATYWHIKIIEPNVGNYLLQMPKTGNHISLMQYAFNFSAGA